MADNKLYLICNEDNESKVVVEQVGNNLTKCLGDDNTFKMSGAGLDNNYKLNLDLGYYFIEINKEILEQIKQEGL